LLPDAGTMRWMMYVVGLHSVMLMIEKGERRQVAATVICVLCALCVLCRSQGSLDFYGVGGVQRYLESKGIALVDVGIALIFYEVTGMLVLVLFWAACFASQPIKHGILVPLQSVYAVFRELVGVGDSWASRAGEMYDIVHAKVQSKFDGVAATLRVDPVRLTTAYCEGAVCRSMCKPLLVPLKLYCTYCMVTGWRLGFQTFMMRGAQ
jgi:hypothetical protein